MATKKLSDKPVADAVGESDKVVVIQGGKVMLAGVEALGNTMGLTEAEAALAELNSVVGGAAE